MRVFLLVAGFLRDLFRSRRMIWELTKKDIRQRYLGSVLGVLWAFIQPTITVLIFWFVFQVGFKSVPVDNFPFILWLVCGMFPWFFFNDAWLAATNSILANSFLVKKVVFRVSLLPIIQVCSALVINLFFVTVLFLMFAAYGYPPSAGALLPVRGDLPCVWIVSDHVVARDLPQGCRAVRRDDAAVRFLGDADLLEPQDDPGDILVGIQAEPDVLRRRGVSG